MDRPIAQQRPSETQEIRCRFCFSARPSVCMAQCISPVKFRAGIRALVSGSCCPEVCRWRLSSRLVQTEVYCRSAWIGVSARGYIVHFLASTTTLL